MGKNSTLERYGLYQKHDIIVPTTKGRIPMDAKAFMDAVESGAYDSSLSEMITCLQKRQKNVRVLRSIHDYEIGSRVKFNSLSGTKYIVGVEGTVVAKKQKKVVVRPDLAIGRFSRYDHILKKETPVDITCPVAILDLV